MFSRITVPFILLSKGYICHYRLRFTDDPDVLREDSFGEVNVNDLLEVRAYVIQVGILSASSCPLLDGKLAEKQNAEKVVTKEPKKAPAKKTTATKTATAKAPAKKTTAKKAD